MKKEPEKLTHISHVEKPAWRKVERAIAAIAIHEGLDIPPNARAKINFLAEHLHKYVPILTTTEQPQ